MNNIPEEIISRAVFAASGKGYCTEWVTRKLIIAGLEGAGVAGMLERIAELESELDQLREFEASERQKWQGENAKLKLQMEEFFEGE